MLRYNRGYVQARIGKMEILDIYPKSDTISENVPE